MRYRDVIEQYVRLRAASRREWKISDTLVLSVSLDVAADLMGPLVMAHGSERRPASPMREQLVRVHQVGDRVQASPAQEVDAAEQQEIDRYRSAVRRWIGGEAESLPPSTSAQISTWLQLR